MFLCELYQSVQGEGLLTGTESIFVRTSGCNLRCDFCDTPFSSWQPEGQHQTIKEIVHQVSQLSARHVVITGGEPMMQRDLPQLTEAFKKAELHITIETAGTLASPVECDLMSISPKLSNSTPSLERAGRWREKHEATRHQPEVMRSLMQRYPYQLKFVVDQPEDLDEIEQYLIQFPDVQRDRVLLMPQGIDSESLDAKQGWIESACRDRGFRFCPRMHIVWYGNKRGT